MRRVFRALEAVHARGFEGFDAVGEHQRVVRLSAGCASAHNLTGPGPGDQVRDIRSQGEPNPSASACRRAHCYGRRREGMAMDPESSRYDRSKIPESSWPDGSPVSNWSKAVAELNRTSQRRIREATAVGSDG